MPSSLLNSTTSPQESQRQQQQQSQPQPQKPEEKFFYENQFDDMEFWMKLAEEWEHSSNPLDLEAALNEATATAKQPAVPVVHEPLEELLKPDHLHHYHFVLENPFLKIEEEEEEEEEAVQEGSEAMKTEDEDDFEEYIRRGLAKLEVGDIPAAILLFEAAAATAPSSARAWLLLGTAQAKNENDRKAIGAMKRCLALDPQNLEALLCLAISFTNESQTAEACAALREWLAAHPKYGHLLEEAEAEAMEEKAKKESENEQQQQQQQQQQYMGPTPLSKRWGAGTSATANSSANIFESGLFERIKGVFIRAATETTAETMDTAEDQQGAAGEQRLPDADVQCGLGVLFSLSGDYEKAADCFRTAVAVRPQEHTLWNRLGATLANGGHSAQAMAAYREALVRYPGYIRARHNLAIACLMLGAEREAVGHLLAVLNLQTAGSRSAAEGGGGEAAAKSSALAEIIANPSSITSAAVWSLLRTALLALHREDLFPAVGDRNLPLLNREFSFGEEEQQKGSVED
ncbi:PEX5- protein [Tyrophagus putrescentiae]|nr:PEX5- protein [Tyrophagus putrescentiae]